MRTNLSTFALLVTGGWLAASQTLAQVPQSYTFQDLGTLGGRYSEAYAVSNTGDVVGMSTLSERRRAPDRAAVWHDMTPAVLPIAVSGRSMASDINNRGEIVGNELFGFPTLWKGAEATTLATQGNRGYANAINERGQVAGQLYHSDGSRGVVWNGAKITDWIL